jgi:hypothetical protein
MDNPPPTKKRRRPFLFWIVAGIVAYAILYPLSFGPVCWLDSLRQPDAESLAMSRPLNTFYMPILHTEWQLDNSFGDAILRYGDLFAAGGRRLETRVLARPGANRGKRWFVWFGKGAVNPPALNQDDMPDSN